jgi:hypothetical protein
MVYVCALMLLQCKIDLNRWTKHMLAFVNLILHLFRFAATAREAPPWDPNQRSPSTTSMHARHQAEAPEVRVVTRVVVLQVGRQDSCRMDGAPVAVKPAPTRARVPRLRCIDLVPRRRRVLHHPSHDPSLHRRRPHSRRSSMCVSVRGRARQTGGGSVCVRARRDGGDAQTFDFSSSFFISFFKSVTKKHPMRQMAMTVYFVTHYRA